MSSELPASQVPCYGFKIVHDREVHCGYCSDHLNSSGMERGVETYEKFYPIEDFGDFDVKVLDGKSLKTGCESGMCNCDSCGANNQFDFEYLGKFEKTLDHIDRVSKYKKNHWISNVADFYMKYMTAPIVKQYRSGKYVQ